MAIEWDETVETKRRVRMLVDGRGSPSAPAAAVWAPGFRDATTDDLRRACEAAGLVVETAERAEADRADRTNLREAYQRLADERDACLDALAEHVSPDATADTPRMIRPSSVLAGIRSLQGRLRDARSDLREHDAALEAAEARRSSEVTGLGEQLAEVVAQRDDLRARLERAEAATAEALTILNAMPGDDIASAARHMMDVRMRQSVGREALRYRLATIVNEAFGAQPVITHEELLSFLESRLRERTRNLAAARARIAELEAPLPEATVEELGRAYRAGSGGFSGQANVFMNGGIRAVAERVRRERPPCLIARAVAANIDVRVAEDVGGGFLVGIHRPEKDEHMVRNVPAAEVPAELARMLTEVGA